jgi:outer membrane protein assembly factor BamB
VPLRSFVALSFVAFTVTVGGCGRSGIPLDDGSPDGVTCGPGTHLVGNECLPGAPSDAGVPGGGGGGFGGGGGGGFGGGGGGPADFGLPANADLAPIPQGDRATTWQIDPAHSGAQPGTRLKPPLKQLWSYDTGGPVGYPIVTDGRVYITSGITGSSGARVAALDASTGRRVWGPIALGGGYVGVATASYDVSLGRLFVMNGDALVEALDPADGHPFWTKQMAAFAGEIGPLVSQSGLLFVPQQWTLLVLDGKSGATRWMGGEGASPMAAAVSSYAVFTCMVGGGVMANDPWTGRQLWLHAPNGDGGGGCLTTLGGDRLYAYDWADPPLVLDPTNGNVARGWTGPSAPAVDAVAGRAYFLIGTNLEAHDVSSDAVLWTFAGDGMLDTQPIAGGGYVYVGGSSGMLYAVDKDGQVAFTDKLPTALTASSSFVNGTAPSGFAIAEDKLFVSAGTVLYAYANN